MSTLIAPSTPVEFPSSREEAWRYTPVDEIVSRFSAASAATRRSADAVPGHVAGATIDHLIGRHDGPTMVFVNGFFSPALSAIDHLPGGLWCGAIDPHRAPADFLLSVTEPFATPDGFVAHNRLGGGDVAAIRTLPGAGPDTRVHVVHIAAADPNVAAHQPTIGHPRTIVRLAPGTRLAVVETYCGLDGLTVTNASTVLHVGDGATLDHCRLQLEGPTATHVGHVHVQHDRGSTLAMTAITIGAGIARTAVDVHLDEPDAEVILTGLHRTSGRQRHDTVVTVDHAASNCTSNQHFAAVADQHGQSSFSGEIIVRPGTMATNAHQQSRNLVLDPTAEADTRPWLRIFADDVRCTHGATVGRLDDDALFYLRSRGIRAEQAAAMLVDAFVGEVTDTITDVAVRDHVNELVSATVSEGGA